ncbi:hypothetical protein PFISCL1PPCAC_17964, partial [Pristionchus fissidentatus]
EVAGNTNEYFEVTQGEGNNAESFKNWLRTIKSNCLFRRLKCHGLRIETQVKLAVIDESMLDQVASQMDFAEIHLRFIYRFYPSIINFARRSKIPIHSITTSAFSPDPREIFELPWTPSLVVHHMAPGFSDEQVLELAKQGRRELVLPANLFDPATLHLLIEIVHSTSLRRLSITVEMDYLDRFLNSIALREKGSQFLDVSHPRS